MKRSVQAATVLRMHGARRSPVIESFNYGAQVARIVSEQHLGRTVTDRMRHARIIALGDRKSSVAQSPCLIATEADINALGDSLTVAIAPFVSAHDSSSLPAELVLRARAPLAYPFEDPAPEWRVTLGHTLPPSLASADSGLARAGVGEVMPVSWQRMLHDESLVDPQTIPGVLVLTDALQLAQHPGRLVRALAVLRTRHPVSLIWCPGLSGPDNLALLTWFGVDLHDLGRSRQAASAKALLTSSGPRRADASLEESTHMDRQFAAWVDELANVRQAIRDGTLRELVERRALNSSRLVEHLRFHDRLMRASLGESAAKREQLTAEDEQALSLLPSPPLARKVPDGRRWRCNSATSTDDALIADWVQRMEDVHTPPAAQSKVLVLLPCSKRKPYRLSNSHRSFRRSLRHWNLHEVMVTAPLGLVPRELEDIWPAAHYDIPVTGDWGSSELEDITRLVRALVSRIGYELVINHSGIDIDADVEVIDTRQGETAGCEAALARLQQASEDAAQRYHSGERMSEREYLLDKFRALSRWYHGTDEWLADAKVVGRPPDWKIFVAGEQFAQWHPRAGRFAFAKASLPLLADTNTLSRVHLQPGPDWKGDVFGPMVDSIEGDIRVGDDVLVLRDGDLLGTARSLAAAWEYAGSPGRLARAKHRL